jgi:hypothetical protein
VGAGGGYRIPLYEYAMIVDALVVVVVVFHSDDARKKVL